MENRLKGNKVIDDMYHLEHAAYWAAKAKTAYKEERYEASNTAAHISEAYSRIASVITDRAGLAPDNTDSGHTTSVSLARDALHDLWMSLEEQHETYSDANRYGFPEKDREKWGHYAEAFRRAITDVTKALDTPDLKSP